MLLVLAQCTALILPPVPRTPNPPGIIMPLKMLLKRQKKTFVNQTEYQLGNK